LSKKGYPNVNMIVQIDGDNVNVWAYNEDGDMVFRLRATACITIDTVDDITVDCKSLMESAHFTIG